MAMAMQELTPVELWSRRLRQWRVNLNPFRFRSKTLLLQRPFAPADQGEVAIFNHYDPAGEVAGYVLQHLQALRALGLSIVFVTTSKDLTAAARRSLAELCWLVLQRPNRGLDLGGWPCALRRIEALLRQPVHRCLKRLVVTNDSVFGPLRPLPPVMSAMLAQGCDIWGITESIEREPHLQSYFLVFERRGLAFVRTWLRSFKFLEDRDALIIRFEIGLSHQARAQGLKLAALVPFDALRRLMDEGSPGVSVQTREHYAARRGWLNPTHAFWRQLLVDLGSPYVKRDLLRDYARFDDGLEPWGSLLASHAPAPALAAIRDYLRAESPGAPPT